jgi:hypothetical protein
MKSSGVVSVFVTCVIACGGNDDPPTPIDAAIAVDASIDAPPPACPTATSCPCFSNYDCPTGYACVSQDNTGTNVYCVPGQRGTGALGAPCTGEGDCASALCVDDVDNGMSCSDVCDTDPTCTAKLPDCTFITTVGVSICTP